MKLEKRGEASEEAQLPQKKEKSPISSKKREISVIIYTLVLFVVALALILLSYKIQQRANTTLSDITEQHGEVTAQALRNIEELQSKNLELTRELGETKAQLEEALERLNELEAGTKPLEQERDALSAQVKELILKVEDLEKGAAAAGTLTKLVLSTDTQEREALLHEMASLSQYLDADGVEIYNEYIEKMNEASGAEDNTNTQETEE